MCVTSQPGIKICNIHCRITADLFLPILVVLFPPTFALKKKINLKHHYSELL